MSAPSPSGEQRLAELHAQLTAAVGALTHTERWRRMLDVAARFHHYSPNNVLLIAVQRPDATLVAGYRTWAQLGRQVQRGERGIGILAPVVARREPEPDTDDALGARTLRGFRAAHVFDVAQTEGRPLPDVRPRLLSGGSPTGLWDQLASQVNAAGYTLDRGPCGSANGYADHERRHVRVRDDVSSAQAAKTLAHELAHVLLHQPDSPPRERRLGEIEAESVAYVVAAGARMPTGDYSVPYVAGWAGGNTDLLRDTASRVLSTARQILATAGAPDPSAALTATRDLPLERVADSRADWTRQLGA
jgi:hypothetical protein